MTEYDNTNKGSMFVNDRKESDNHPDRTGSACIECPNCGTKTDYWQSGWLKTSKAGKKFLSQSFKPKEAAPVARTAAAPFDDIDSLPF